MFKVVRDILRTPSLKRRILVVFGLLAIYRVGFFIYLPGVQADVLDDILEELNRESGSGGLMQFVRFTSQLTGGSLSQATVFSLGIMPYISASIIFSLLVKVFPAMEELQKEGESGRKVINRYTRYATVALCLIQSLVIVRFLHTQFQGRFISEGGAFEIVLQIVCLTTGTLFLMWLGEKITEHGIGNGVSILIMAGIIANMPSGLLAMVSDIFVTSDENIQEAPFKVLRLLILLGLFFGIIVAVVYITRGQRRIPIQQARSVKGRRTYGGQRHYMPIRVNSAGVLPIIFAQSLLLLPAGIISALVGDNAFTDLFTYGTFSYQVFYVLMIGFFTFFWTSLMFNPVEISQNMKENGSFVPGIRPGKRTAEYLEHVINRITLAGAAFLSAIALVPIILTNELEVQALVSNFMGGTGILIVVGVALDIVDKVEAQLLVRQYEGFLESGKKTPPGGGAAAVTTSGTESRV